MEATGVYWTPVWQILSEGEFELLVANAAHIKNVPGRKPALGLDPGDGHQRCHVDCRSAGVRADQGEFRSGGRHPGPARADAYPQAAAALDSVISDIVGVSGRRMIEAMIAGVRNPHRLAELAHRGIKASPKELYDALHGRLTEHQRFPLQLHLAQWGALDAAIQQIDQEVDGRIERMDEEAKYDEAPFRSLILLLCSIPGVSVLSATTILAEIGRDMSRFPTAGHLLAWAGLCPEQNQSAGKQKSSRLRKGDPWLKTMLAQCAWAAKRQKNSYYMAQFQRLKSRRWRQKAICAVAAFILTAIYHMLKNRVPHHDLGADYFDRRSPETKVRRLVAQLSRLGFEAKLQPLAQAA
jgi:transposase